MDIIFADDSKQAKPSRLGAGSFVAIGGVHVASERVGALERAIDRLCARVGFPPGEQFKWSPGTQESFMRRHLTGARRDDFYAELLALAAKFEVAGCVVVVDSHYNPANRDSADPEHDATTLFLERVSYALNSAFRDGLVLIAMPSGGAAEGQRFVAKCLGLLEAGTAYDTFPNLPLGVVAAQSRQMRLLQLADVVTSCTVARVSGEPQYSRPIFDLVRPLLRKNADRVGGIGLKIHPEYVYQNLYYWLVGDRVGRKDGVDRALPDPALPFHDHPNEALVTGDLMRQARRES